MLADLTLALDVMGGDHGADTVLPAAELALERQPDLKLILFGDRQVIEPRLEKTPRTRAAGTIVHTDVAVAMDDKPSQALRRGRRTSSMWRAIEAVKTGDANAAVSAGNTGALMAMAKVILKTVDNVGRPAIAAIWPTIRGESIVLDVGANIGADADQLVSFALMGRAMSRTIYGLGDPKVGLLNIGQEEIKGLDQVKQAAAVLRDEVEGIDYHGFVEGNDIGKGVVDVVVTEGFAGNIALKTAEGTANQISHYLKQAMGRSPMARLGYLLSRGAFAALREKLDPRAANGGVFLGLRGIVVKSHGGTDATGHASAIELAAAMAREELVERIIADLDAYHAAGHDHAGEQHKKVSVS
jgi:glycerol-3-phosphate acyltransferase PlsX